MKFSNLLMPVLIAACLALPPVNLARAGQKAASEASTEGSDVDLIPAETLLDHVNKGKPIIILDLRNEGSYKSSSKRIPGDIRIDRDSDLDTKLKDIPHDSFIVAYCT